MPDTACAYAETRALAARKLALIEQKMTDLAAMHQVLGGLVERCDAGDRGTDRPISDVLAGRITSSWVAQFSISSHEPFDSPENMGQYEGRQGFMSKTAETHLTICLFRDNRKIRI